MNKNDKNCEKIFFLYKPSTSFKLKCVSLANCRNNG